MRIANLSGRLVVVTGPPQRPVGHDVAQHSDGRFGPDPQAVYDVWADFVAWAGELSWRNPSPIDLAALGSPVPAPRQVFAIGLNYSEHAVLRRRAHRVAAAQALQHVAGYAVGQAVSERVLQMAAQPPQFSLGKSLPGFGPIGPWLVTADELADPADVAIGCAVNGEVVRTGVRPT